MTRRIYAQTAVERRFGILSRQAELLMLAAVAILLVHWMLVLWFVISRLGSLSFLRLHYTAALGVDWIDTWWKIFVFPGFGLVVLLVNGLLAGELSKSYKLLGLLLLGVTIFLEIIFAIGGVMAMLLNG